MFNDHYIELFEVRTGSSGGSSGVFYASRVNKPRNVLEKPTPSLFEVEIRTLEVWSAESIPVSEGSESDLEHKFI